MKIGQINQIAEAYKAPQIRKTVQKPGIKGRDEVLISREGLEFDHAKKLAAQIPDIREDKVSAAAKKLESGSFGVSAAMIAQKMLETI